MQTRLPQKHPIGFAEYTWLHATRDAIVFGACMYALYWLLIFACVGIHGAAKCGC